MRRWAAELSTARRELRRLGYFGSYARGDWGVGSDLDLIGIVAATDEPIERRALDWDLTQLPVPAEILILTEPEWRALELEDSRFARVLNREAVWVV